MFKNTLIEKNTLKIANKNISQNRTNKKTTNCD